MRARTTLLALLTAAVATSAGCVEMESTGDPPLRELQISATSDSVSASNGEIPEPTGPRIAGEHETRPIGPLALRPVEAFEETYELAVETRLAGVLLVVRNQGEGPAIVEASWASSVAPDPIARERLSLAPGEGGAMRLVLEGDLHGQAPPTYVALTLTTDAPVQLSGTLYHGL